MTRPGHIPTFIDRLPLVAVWCGILLFTSSPARAESGEELFVKSCASCHGRDGQAKTPIGRKIGVKDLTQSKLTDDQIEKQVTDGFKDSQGHQKMPAFKGTLTPEQIKALIPVVKALRK